MEFWSSSLEANFNSWVSVSLVLSESPYQCSLSSYHSPAPWQHRLRLSSWRLVCGREMMHRYFGQSDLWLAETKCNDMLVPSPEWLWSYHNMKDCCHIYVVNLLCVVRRVGGAIKTVLVKSMESCLTHWRLRDLNGIWSSSLEANFNSWVSVSLVLSESHYHCFVFSIIKPQPSSMATWAQVVVVAFSLWERDDASLFWPVWLVIGWNEV